MFTETLGFLGGSVWGMTVWHAVTLRLLAPENGFSVHGLDEQAGLVAVVPAPLANRSAPASAAELAGGTPVLYTAAVLLLYIRYCTSVLYGRCHACT